MDWQVKVTRHLIEGGVMGRPQSELIAKAGGNAHDGEVRAFLMTLAADRKVQKFILPGQKVFWRATSEIERLSPPSRG
jgi:hypothetical protein